MDGQDIQVCLSLGSNIAPAENIKNAVEMLRQQLLVLSVSRAWKTPAVGSLGPEFLNAAVLVCTSLAEDQLKEKVLRQIESRLGRTRSEDKYAPRTIDIDIVVYGDRIRDPNLWKFAHLAQPVAELLPDLVEKASGRPLEQIARDLVIHSAITPAPDVLESE